MTDQGKLEAVVNLEDKIITLKKDTIEVRIVLFEEGNRLSEVFEEADAANLWLPNNDSLPVSNVRVPSSFKDGWRLEVGGMKYPITVKGQEEQLRPTKRMKIDMLDIAISTLSVEFGSSISTIDYYIMSNSSVLDALKKLGTLAAPMVPDATIFNKQKEHVRWLEIPYPCRTYEYEFVDMKFLPDITAVDAKSITSSFETRLKKSVSTEPRNVQDNKFLMVPATYGTGKTTIAFLMSRHRYVMFVDVSGNSGSFAIVKDIATSFGSILLSVIKRFPEYEFNLRVWYCNVVMEAIKLFVAVHLKLVLEFHKKYRHHNKRHELFLRFLLNGGKYYPNLWMRDHMNKILVTTGDTVKAFYSSVVAEMGQEGLNTHDLLFFVDELPTLKDELHVFLRQKYLSPTLSVPDKQAALSQKKSLLYVVRQVFLTLVCDAAFSLPMAGAGTDIEIAVQQDVLPSPWTRNNLDTFTELVHVTALHVANNTRDRVSSSITQETIDTFAWKFEGRAMWYAEYFLRVLWENEAVISLSSPEAAVKAAWVIGLKAALARAESVAQEFIEGTQTYIISKNPISARELAQMVYYGLVMRGGNLDLPDYIIWQLVDKGLVHVRGTLQAPSFSNSQPEDDIVPIETEVRVTVAEPIMQQGIHRAFKKMSSMKAVVDDPILSLLAGHLFTTSHLLGTGLSYHGNFGERAIARLLQIKQDHMSKEHPISHMPGFECLKGTVFDYYRLSVSTFGSPKEFYMDDVAALIGIIHNRGVFPGFCAGPDIHLVLKKMPRSSIEKLFGRIDMKLYVLCPKIARVGVQCKCRASTTGIGALRSLDPAFFYKVRAVKPQKGEEDVDEELEKDLKVQSEASKQFDSWLDINNSAYDVYLRVIYSHKSFGTNFIKQCKSYNRSGVARLRPIVLLDSAWLDENNRSLFDHICGPLETPLTPAEDQKLIDALIAETSQEKNTKAATQDILRSLGLFVSGSADQVRDSLNAYLHWHNDPTKALCIGIPISSTDLSAAAENRVV